MVRHTRDHEISDGSPPKNAGHCQKNSGRVWTRTGETAVASDHLRCLRHPTLRPTRWNHQWQLRPRTVRYNSHDQTLGQGCTTMVTLSHQRPDGSHWKHFKSQPRTRQTSEPNRHKTTNPSVIRAVVAHLRISPDRPLRNAEGPTLGVPGPNRATTPWPACTLRELLAAAPPHARAPDHR